MKKYIKALILFLALSGAINWGLLGLFDLNIVTLSFGENTFLTKLTYLLISLSNLYLLLYPDLGGDYVYWSRKRKSELNYHGVAAKQTIDPASPSIKEQENFISEGGNSQPLEKS
jgi:uncharacterized membrane protein YuzA (DUF378 family)